jgi:hypothetical protein
MACFGYPTYRLSGGGVQVSENSWVPLMLFCIAFSKEIERVD